MQIPFRTGEIDFNINCGICGNECLCKFEYKEGKNVIISICTHCMREIEESHYKIKELEALYKTKELEVIKKFNEIENIIKRNKQLENMIFNMFD